MVVSRRNFQQNGFTLIELVVVMAIIVVLVGLVLAGIMKVMAIPDREQTRHEISLFEESLSKFKTEFGVYPPSKILLSNDPNQYTTHPLGPTSVTYITKIWPKLDMTKSHDWSGGTITGPYAEELEGDQCLVFFLGGLPQVNPTDGSFYTIGFQEGFSDPTWSDSRISPAKKKKDGKIFFRFDSARLVKRSGNQFLSYLDVYGQKPFAYFSSGFRKNGYNEDDCSSLGVKPYYHSTSPKKYFKADTVQLFSAGLDTQFGLVTEPWDPTLGNAPPGGEDDHANFHEAQLGVGIIN